MLAYSIAAGLSVGNIDRVIISTDSEKYVDIAKEYGAEVPFMRPAEISGDRSTDYECMKHALDWMRDNEGYEPAYLAHLRPTTPLREVSYIADAIELMKRSNQATALRSAHKMSESAYKTFEIEGDYLKCVGSGSLDVEAANRARQEFEDTYQPNGYVDVIRTSYVIENGKLHGDRVLAYLTPCVTEVDAVEDLDYLEYQISKKPELAERLFSQE